MADITIKLFPKEVIRKFNKWPIYKYGIPVKNIGSGSYGQIWSTGNNYVFKIIKLGDEKFQYNRSSLNELIYTSSVEHPGLIKYLDMFIVTNDDIHDVLQYVSEYPYDSDIMDTIILVMEKYEGSMMHHVKSPSKVGFKYITYQVVTAMAYLESRNIIHNDIKPQNIFYKYCMQATKYPIEWVIADFGMASNSECLKVDRISELITITFRAPEIILAEMETNNDTIKYSSKSDVWSMGCTLYELFTGTALFFAARDSDDPYRDYIYQLFLLFGAPHKNSKLYRYYEIFLKKEQYRKAAKKEKMAKMEQLEEKYNERLMAIEQMNQQNINGHTQQLIDNLNEEHEAAMAELFEQSIDEQILKSLRTEAKRKNIINRKFTTNVNVNNLLDKMLQLEPTERISFAQLQTDEFFNDREDNDIHNMVKDVPQCYHGFVTDSIKCQDRVKLYQRDIDFSILNINESKSPTFIKSLTTILGQSKNKRLTNLKTVINFMQFLNIYMNLNSDEIYGTSRILPSAINTLYHYLSIANNHEILESEEELLIKAVMSFHISELFFNPEPHAIDYFIDICTYVLETQLLHVKTRLDEILTAKRQLDIINIMETTNYDLLATTPWDVINSQNEAIDILITANKYLSFCIPIHDLYLINGKYNERLPFLCIDAAKANVSPELNDMLNKIRDYYNSGGNISRIYNL